METIKDEWTTSPLNSSGAHQPINYVAILKKASLLIARSLVAVGVFCVAWSLFDPRFPPLTFLDLRVLALAAILLAAGVIDIAKGVVPIEITFPLMLAGIVRAIVAGDPSFLLYWFALAIIYLFNVVGGGDVKLLMGLFGLWPQMEFFIVMEIVVVATHLPIVLYRRLRCTKPRVLFRFMTNWIHLRVIELMTGERTTDELVRQAIARRPTNEDLSKHGDRLAIAFSLAGIIYLFLAASVGLDWHS